MKIFTQIMLCLLAAGLLPGSSAPAGEKSTPSGAGQGRVHAAHSALFGPSEFLARLPREQQGNDAGVFFKSLLLPGWGQHSLQASRAKRNFIISELALWGTVAAFLRYSTWLEQEYKAFAAMHAGVRTDGYDDQFWVDIGNYDSVEQWNDASLSDRDIDALRDPDGDEAWRWDSVTNRLTFDNTRIASDRAFERAQFTIAAIIGNHIISGLHALWLKRKQRRDAAAQQARVDIRLLPTRQRGSRLSLVVHF